ncbi:unnamed protein product [Closterium sp. NIES-64]|nr:unnamed protein product [Closterium sp. NIES-64]
MLAAVWQIQTAGCECARAGGEAAWSGMGMGWYGVMQRNGKVWGGGAAACPGAVAHVLQRSIALLNAQLTLNILVPPLPAPSLPLPAPSLPLPAPSLPLHAPSLPLPAPSLPLHAPSLPLHAPSLPLHAPSLPLHAPLPMLLPCYHPAFPPFPPFPPSTPSSHPLSQQPSLICRTTLFRSLRAPMPLPMWIPSPHTPPCPLTSVSPRLHPLRPTLSGLRWQSSCSAGAGGMGAAWGRLAGVVGQQ